MSENKKTSTSKVITGKCRLSYEHIWEAAKMEDDGPAKYSACIIIPKSDNTTLRKIRAAIDVAVQDGVKSKWSGKKPAKLKLPLRDGDEERPDDEVFKNAYFINANANRRPGVVDLALNEIMDRDEVYSGCYCRFSLNFFPYAARGNNGVGVGLNNVQKVADGERLSGGSRAEDDFNDGYADDADDFGDL